MRLVLVSDTHLTPRAAAFGDNWERARVWIDATAPDLVVNLGDITADGAHDPEELEAARRVFDRLSRPMRFLPGNHDIGDNPIEVGRPNEHPLDLGRLADYRRLFGPDRWAFEAGRWTIIGLNAQLFATEGGEEAVQFAWLTEQLRRCSGPLGLMLHKPLFRNGPQDTEAHVRYVPGSARRRLLGLLAACDLRFVVSGHVHQARSIEVDGVEHAWVPSTAYCMPDAMQERIGEKAVGLLTLELTDGGHRFEPANPPGLLRHNLLDHPAVYPKLTALKEQLGVRAALP
jgi:3',5'-cyclic AMP phosphodiesterase CpdA